MMETDRDDHLSRRAEAARIAEAHAYFARFLGKRSVTCDACGKLTTVPMNEPTTVAHEDGCDSLSQTVEFRLPFGA